ncbi:MAG TPA: asparagine synthase-related protein [Xanthobacteraceae bacterium]|nr:asparagine synthase-related protein [Xanthobacteraceae bacterium]
MSAIFGILRFDGGAASGRDLERMSHALAHRGPDGIKFIIDGSLALGHGLMRVNEEDAFEAQPLRDDEANVTLVADCRIDNRNELAAIVGIGAADLPDLPDSALLLRAYKKWGENCAEHLLGDFAFAIWDGGAKKLVLGRDHMGQRYVHYHLASDFFAFATEIKALWSYPDVPRVLPDAKIGRMLMHDLSPREGETPFDGIHGVPGATVVTVGADATIRKRRYWQPHADPVHENRDEAYYIDAYASVLGEAVACRLRRTIRAPGIVFSGGYDSAAIAGLAGSVLAGSGRKLIAATSVMPADYRGTIRHARRWVEMCARDMPHLDVRYVTREGKMVLSGLEQALVDSELPVSSYHFATSELLSSLADAGAQVIMDGHGGDYTLHPRGQAALARFLATLQLRRFVTELRGHLRLSGRSLWITLKNDIAALLLPASVVALWQRLRHGSAPIWRDQPINPAFAKELIEQGGINERNLRIAAKPKLDMREQMSAMLRRVTTGSAPGMAASAARHGLELTRPFHDKRVVELALAIPQDLYVKNGRNRFLACAALRDIYPREFQNRWRKNDDEIPDFQRMAKSIAPQLLADIARMEKSENLSRMIDFAKIRALFAARGPDDHNSGWEQETQLALSGLMVARYVEWFRRANG